MKLLKFKFYQYSYKIMSEITSLFMTQALFFMGISNDLLSKAMSLKASNKGTKKNGRKKRKSR